MCGGRGRAAQTERPRPDHSAGAEKAVGWSSQLAWVVWGMWPNAEEARPMEWKELSARCIWRLRQPQLVRLHPRREFSSDRLK